MLGGEEVTINETKFNPPSTPTASLFPSFEPKGTLEDWKDTVDFIIVRTLSYINLSLARRLVLR